LMECLAHRLSSPNVQYIHCVCMVILYIWRVIWAIAWVRAASLPWPRPRLPPARSQPPPPPRRRRQRQRLGHCTHKTQSFSTDHCVIINARPNQIHSMLRRNIWTGFVCAMSLKPIPHAVHQHVDWELLVQWSHRQRFAQPPPLAQLAPPPASSAPPAAHPLAARRAPPAHEAIPKHSST